MVLVPGSYVDQAGMVSLPYIEEWDEVKLYLLISSNLGYHIPRCSHIGLALYIVFHKTVVFDSVLKCS